MLPYTTYCIAGNFRGVKNWKMVIFVSINFSLVSLPALHSYVTVSHAYVKISWR